MLYAVLATLFVLFSVAFFQFGLFTRSTSALGDLFLNLEKPLIGLEFFSIGLIFAPDDAELCSKRANVERFLGKNTDAVDDLSHLITLTGSRDALVQRARCYINLRKSNEAMADLNEVLKSDQSNVDALIMRGELNCHRGNHKHEHQAVFHSHQYFPDSKHRHEHK